jgi:hypothetical protein
MTEDHQQDAYSSDEEERDYRYNCDQLRTKIQGAIEKSGVEQFLQDVQCDKNAYLRFMSYKGKLIGNTNPLFQLGNKYFDRLQKDTPRPPSKRIKVIESDYVQKVESVDLPEEIPIYDTCDEVREKINHFLDTKVMTKTDFTRYLGVNSNSLRTFMLVTGDKKGAGNCTYPKAYRFFERYRIACDEPKTPQRIALEQSMPQGFETVNERTLKKDGTKGPE